MSTNGTNGSAKLDGFKPRMLINGEVSHSHPHAFCSNKRLVLKPSTQLVEASDGKTFTLYNPATTEKVADGT